MAAGLEVACDKETAAIGGLRMTDSGWEGSAAPPGKTARTGRLLPFEAQWEEPRGRSEVFDALVKDIRSMYGSDIPSLFPRMAKLVERRIGVAPKSPLAPVLAGLLGVGIRLGFALLATALVGQWAGIPWGRWVAILVFFGLFDAWALLMARPLPWVWKVVEDWTALLPTIVRESDLQDLADYTRRSQRLSITAIVGVTVAAIMLSGSLLFAPTAMSELPIGSIVLLAFLLCDFGTYVVYGGNLVNRALMAREAKYDHHLFWPSPADSPEVRKAMGRATGQGFGAGMWITVFLVLTVVLVSWDSPLVLPLAVGFLVIGYLTTIGSALSNRGSVRRIVERISDRRLAVLRDRIDAFGPRFADLSPEESERLRGLIDLHNMMRDAPTTPTGTRTAIHAAVGLLIPTIMFVVTVFGEVYAERVLDAILP
jgi:hypothetical protein